MKRTRGLRINALSVLALFGAEAAVLTAPAWAQSNAAQGCQSLYQRRNRDHCRQQLTQGAWPCSALPVQDLQDLKNCAEVFDPTLFSSQNRSEPPARPLPAPEPAPEAAAPEPVRIESAPAPAGEVLPLRMIDMEIATAQAAQQASMERRRSVEKERARVARQLGVESVDRGPPPKAKGEVLELYRELGRLQAESDRLNQQISAQDAALEEAKKRRETAEAELARVEAAPPAGSANTSLGALLLAGGAAMLAALLGGLVMWRRRSDGGPGRTRIFAQRPDAATTMAGAGPVSDCMLVGGEGMSFLLAGSLLAQGGVVVGRHSSQVQVVIDRPEVSRRHARFAMRGGALTVEDLGSANGTNVDGARLRAGERRVVANGAQIQFGPYVFSLRTSASPRP